jgi:serine/threonine protein phosphatase PrpC
MIVLMSGKSFKWRSSSRTDVGTVRDVNEDACIELPRIGLWAVADGMGGHSAGDLASSSIIEFLSSLPAPETLSSFVDDVERGLVELNARLREVATREQVSTIGSTVAALLLFREHCVCLWAGDSRIYRHREGHLEQLTQDHALVEELVERGVLTPEEAAGHPQSNLVTRAVGASDTLYIDAEIFELRARDRFVLCSDGLDKEVSDEEIARLAERESIDSLSDALVELALSRGARDNVTVVAVEVTAVEVGTEPVSDTVQSGGSSRAR